MGADAFYVCYGLRWEVNADNEDEVAQLEKRQDPRQLAARKQKLDSLWGATTNQSRYFVLIGKILGKFGWENEHSATVEDADLARLVENTRQSLCAAGFNEPPRWYFQFEPDL